MTPTVRADTALLAALLGAVSGSVDVLVFTRLGEVFASVITGNVVVIGVAIGSGRLGVMAHAAVAVACYAIGVALAGVITRGADEKSPQNVATPLVITYVVEFAALCGMGVIWAATGGRPDGAYLYLALALAAVAMGIQSRAFLLERLPGVTTTYFTGTLTGLVTGLVTDGRVNRPAAIALLALLAGAIASGVLVSIAPIAAPAVPIVLLAGAVVVVIRRRRHE